MFLPLRPMRVQSITSSSSSNCSRPTTSPFSEAVTCHSTHTLSRQTRRSTLARQQRGMQLEGDDPPVLAATGCWMQRNKCGCIPEDSSRRDRQGGRQARWPCRDCREGTEREQILGGTGEPGRAREDHSDGEKEGLREGEGGVERGRGRCGERERYIVLEGGDERGRGRARGREGWI